MTVNTLHCHYLGNMRSFCKYVIWLVLQSGVYGEVGNLDQQTSVAMQTMARELALWYRERRRSLRAKVTEIQQLSKRLLGSSQEPTCKTKGAETWGLLLFLIDLLQEKLSRLPPEAAHLAEAGRSLARCMQIFNENGVRLSEDSMQECWDCYQRFCNLTAHVEELLQPKRHLFYHLIKDLRSKGNPRFFANWRDEGLNKLLRSACRQISQAAFEPSLLVNMECLLEDEERKGKHTHVREGP